MKLLFTCFLIVLVHNIFAQSSQVLPNSVVFPSVSVFPSAPIGSIVFKTPENGLFSYNGSEWKQLQVVSQEGFSCQIGNFNNCCNYPNYPSIVYLKSPNFKYGDGTLSNSSYTVAKSGVYQFSASFTTTTFDTTPSLFFLTIYIFKNGNVLKFYPFNNQSSSTNSSSTISDFINLNAGDIIQMKISNNYGGGVTPHSDGSYFSLLKIY